jgi:formylglycine-generating enzyme required for sulfatase activity
MAIVSAAGSRRTAAPTGGWVGAAILVILLAPTGRAQEASAAEGVAKRAGFEPLGVNSRGALVFKRLKDGARVIWIPEGSFRQRSYTRRESQEVPVRLTYLPGFAIDETEVTNERCCRFLNAAGRDRGDDGHVWVQPVAQGMKRVEGAWRPETGCGRLPALGVTGHGALAYAHWVGGDLPRIAEWQKAAGGPQGLEFPWGEQAPDARRANFLRDGPGAPTPVGSYPDGVSPYGCHDMAGNVYERVWSGTRWGRRDLPVMIRGASWASPHPMNLRTNCLCMQPMGVADRTVGFRCVVRSGPGLPPSTRERLRFARSWEEAREEAKARNCPILASLQYDTCGQCDRVRVGLFRDPAFIRFVNEHAVLIVGHKPGDAEDAPHTPGPDDACPLYPGLTCLDHHVIWDDLLPRVERFRISPGMFILDPRVEDSRPRSERILVGEAALPKWGGGAEVYIARLKEAQARMGKGMAWSEWRRKKG